MLYEKHKITHKPATNYNLSDQQPPIYHPFEKPILVFLLSGIPCLRWVHNQNGSVNTPTIG